MMMNFLDLSAASEEECRLIREILSDTSVVNIADPFESKLIATATNSLNSQLAAPNHLPNRSNLSQPEQLNYHPSNQTLPKQGQNNPQQLRQLNNLAKDYANESVSVGSAIAKAQPETVAKNYSDSRRSPLIPSQQAISAGSLHHNLNDKSNSSPQDSNYPSTLSIDGSTSPDHTLSTSLNTLSTTNATNNDNAENSLNGLKASPGAGENINQDDMHTLNPNVHTSNGQLLDQHQPPYSIQQYGSYTTNGQKQVHRNNSSANNVGSNNIPNASNHGHTNHVAPIVATQNYRNNYNGHRKSAHNSGNISNNSSNNIHRNRVPSMSNVSSGSSPNNTNVQPIYSQQFTTPHPSNVIPTTLYHNMNVNNMSSTAINNQLSHQHQRATEHGSDRLRGMGSHMHSNNIVSTNSSIMPNIGHVDQHGNSIPLNMYNQHPTHMHHQVPPVMPTQKVDTKNNGSKNSSYHVQETPNNLQTPNQGGQPSGPSGQMPQMAGDMNTVIGMDMTAHPQGYAIQTFAPPHPHQMFSGPPIFQPHPYSYLIPYNLPPYVPYVPIPPNSVPPRPQVQPQTSHTSSSDATTTSHPRQSHSINQQLNNEHYNSGMTSDRNISVQQSRLDNSKAGNQNRAQVQTSTSRDSGLASNPQIVSGANPNSVSPRPVTQDPNSFDKPPPGSHNQAAPLHDRPNKGRHSNKVPNSTDFNSIPGKSEEVSANEKEKIDRLESDTNENACVSVASSRNSGLSAQQQDTGGTPMISASSISADLEVPKSGIGTSAHVQSSLEVSHIIQESSNKPNTIITKKPQSMEGGNKSSPSHVSHDYHDLKGTEDNQRSAGQSASSASKSWADLFKRNEGHANLSHDPETGNCPQWVENSDEEGKGLKLTRKNESVIQPSNVASTKEHRSQDVGKRVLDKMAHRIAMKVNTINLKHALPFLKPRGFINKGNGCYINATLQALIACPPFYNLMKEIGDLRVFRRENSCTPILDSFAELFLNFPPLDSGKKSKQSGSNEPKLGISSLQADAIEPKCIYNVLGNIKSECLRGAQEDAEEFLSSVLNGLHEEMIGLGEILHESNDQNSHQSDVDDSNDDNTNDDNLWREVGSKNRSLPIRIAKVVNTPIQEIFGGSLFSIRTAGKDRCGHRSPFFDLQLDISGDNVKSVQDAIKSFTFPEIIHDFYCSKTKQKLDAQRKTSLDQLPPILILHLKQFIYTQDCGLKKLMKKIEYPIDFELPESCLHEKNSADKNLLTSRSYKLLAVVYHDGKEAVKGHYLTDVYHIGSSQWIRCDDSNLKAISSPRIENPEAPRTPYLLFYRRLNTLRAQSNNHDKKKN